MNSALDVARFIVNYCNEHNYLISNLKLQKLLYFVQAYFLACTESQNPCFEDPIEAWDYGPVVPSVYHEFKQYGSSCIPAIRYYYEFGTEDSLWSLQKREYSPDVLSEEDRNSISLVIDEFGHYSAYQLVELTHHQAPWKDAYIPRSKCRIEIESIRRYFQI